MPHAQKKVYPGNVQLRLVSAKVADSSSLSSFQSPKSEKEREKGTEQAKQALMHYRMGLITNRMLFAQLRKTWGEKPLEWTRKNHESIVARCRQGYAELDPDLSDLAGLLLEIGPRPSPLMSVDRIDNDLGYVKGNIRWADKSTQTLNRSNTIFLELGGRKQTITRWAEELSVPVQTLYKRRAKGLTDSEILTGNSLIVFPDTGRWPPKKIEEFEATVRAAAKWMPRDQLLVVAAIDAVSNVIAQYCGDMTPCEHSGYDLTPDEKKRLDFYTSFYQRLSILRRKLPVAKFASLG